MFNPTTLQSTIAPKIPARIPAAIPSALIAIGTAAAELAAAVDDGVKVPAVGGTVTESVPVVMAVLGNSP